MALEAEDVKLVQKLKITMLSINKMIDYAEEKVTTDPSINPLLDELKDVVYDAEDLLDVIAFQLAHENEVSSTTPLNPFDRSLHQELEDVLYRMKCLLKQTKVFGLKPSTRSNSTSETLRLPTTSLVEQSGVYGRDDDKEEIKNLLLSNHGSNGDVIAIVGMGGLGKTTLAQLLFNHYQIDSVFKPYKVWICVAKDFDVVKITRTILERLTSQSYATNDLDLLQTKLKETLSGKKFLIVLDDVWEEKYTNWDNLRRPFGFAAPGSKIIVTTRSERVVEEMRATTLYKLKPLSDEACWKLFSEHAFENMLLNADSTFEANVVKKCGGLPLAAKVLGGLLRGLGREEWDEILRSNIWDLPNEVLPVLRLSYHYLPSNLKRCFAFCSLVPKDFDFEREKLVLLWMAENLLQDSKSKRRIDVGYEYLRHLESRSLIQPSTEKGELYFSMHDLVNELAKSVSGEFYKSLDLGNSFNAGEKTRHFSYAVPYVDYDDPARFKRINEAKRLRTFLWLFRQRIPLPPLLRSEIWPQLHVLRSLTLAFTGFDKLPDSIGNLKLLRYLNLSDNDQFIELPESVASLYNLEVLILENCRSLTKLPTMMRQLIKLNHLDITHTSLQKMPLQIGRLKDLDLLTDFVVGKDSGSSIRELKELKYLRGRLYIHGLENITHPEDALVANLKEKSKLEKLILGWEDINSVKSEDARIILENLKPPHVNLKRLFIYRYAGTRLPDWSGHYSFVNLVDIRVFDFKHCLDLSPLGQLPSLESLYIYRCDSLVTLIPVELPNEIHHSVPHFSALLYLHIAWCPNFEYFEAGKLCAPQVRYLRSEKCESLKVLPENMSNLSYLKIYGCKKLIANRSSWGLQRLLSLSFLRIGEFECDDLESFPEIGLLPNSLSTLEIEEVTNLRSLNGKGFQLLTSLETLKLRFCPNLQCLPELPTSLSSLIIEKCPLLESRYQREQGENWSKIAHIPNIQTHFDFVVGKGSGPSIGELKELTDLRGELRIRGLQNITHPGDALEANLEDKSRIEELLLIWEDIDSDNWEDARIILENLRPHVNLKRLNIYRYSGTRLPDWSGHYSFVNLVWIGVFGFKHCFDLSPLGQLPSLFNLSINECDSLVTLIPFELPNEIHHRVGHFSALQWLSIDKCDSLVTLVGTKIPVELPNDTSRYSNTSSVIHYFIALVYLYISDCPKLELPHHCFTSVQDFTLSKCCDSLQILPLNLFPQLKKLHLHGLRSIESLAVMDEANSLNLKYLESVKINRCLNFEYWNAGKWCAPKMTYLELEICESLKVLPENMCNLFPSLLKLKLNHCPNLEALPQSGLPGNLSTLQIYECKKLIANRSTWGLRGLLSLSTFVISNSEYCDDLQYSFPEEGLLPSSLSTLQILNVPNLTNLNGKSFQLFTSLETLLLQDCPNLQCLPEQGLPTSLSSLIIEKCPLLETRCQREQGEDWSKIAHIRNIQVDSKINTTISIRPM